MDLTAARSVPPEPVPPEPVPPEPAPVVSPAREPLTRIEALIRALDPAIFDEPEEISDKEYWIGLIPFAFYAMRALAPRRLVELGTETGNSYFAFCQAVRQARLGTECTAIDTWQGDLHTGAYDEAVFRRVEAINQSRNAGFSRLLRLPFADAARQFADRSIDLIHLDGLHTEAAVREDVETWLPKLSERGVLLMHDIAVRDGEFGVWKVYDELCGRYPHLTLPHSNGLGVVGVGAEVPERFAWLFALEAQDDQATIAVKRLFAQTGSRLVDALRARRAVDLGERLGRAASEARDAASARDRLRQRLDEAAARESGLASDLAHAIRQAEAAQVLATRGRSQRLQLQARIRALTAELEAEKITRSSLESELGFTQQRLNAIYASTSWRLSAPVRWAGQMARRARARPATDPGAAPNPARAAAIPVIDQKALDLWRRGVASDPRPRVLAISHYGGGGTERHIVDLAEKLSRQARFLLLHSMPEGGIRLRDLDPVLTAEFIFAAGEIESALIDLLHKLGIARIHLHHLYGAEDYAGRVIAALDRPFDTTVHDFFVLAPQPQLVDAGGRFIGDDLAAGWEGLRWSTYADCPDTPAEWLERTSWAIERADRVIAPSHDAANRLRRAFPDARLIVSAHPAIAIGESGAPVPALLTEDRPMRILLLGELSMHKGLGVLERVALLAQRQGAPLEFHLLGTPAGPLKQGRLANLIVHGAYSRRELAARLAGLAPDIAWFPAQWPETFSYTLSEVFGAGLPVVVSDLGALPERCAGRPWSWVQPWDASAGQWLDLFLRIRDRHLMPGLAPDPPVGDPPAGADFYAGAYTAPLRIPNPANTP